MGMCEKLADIICHDVEAKIAPKAKETIVIPATVPDPTVSITSYSSTEGLIKAIQGDTSVKPVEKKIILSRDALADSQNNQ